MPTFEYVAIAGNGKNVKSTLEASSIETAKSSLRGIGYTILEIKEQSALSLNRDINLPFLGNPKAKDMAIFCRQFVSILRAGVPISTVLGMLAQQTQNAKLAAAIRDIQSDIEKGNTLAQAMRSHPKIFNNMLVNMVAAGEESGNLEDSFHQMELYFDKVKRTKSTVGKAMVYPILLLVVMVIVLIVMMTSIIPKFLQTFEEMDMDLPKVTQAVMNVSDWFVGYWWLLAIIIVGLILFCTAFARTDQGKHFFGWLSRKIPVLKDLTIRSSCATFARTLSLLLSSGLVLTDALELVANNMKNIWFREAVLHIRTQITEGVPLNRALRESGLFPPMVYNLVGIGEEVGDLQDMLTKIADYYDEEVESATQKLLSLMEPAIIIFMAFFALIIVLSIFLPMLNMTKAYDSYL